MPQDRRLKCPHSCFPRLSTKRNRDKKKKEKKRSRDDSKYMSQKRTKRSDRNCLDRFMEWSNIKQGIFSSKD